MSLNDDGLTLGKLPPGKAARMLLDTAFDQSGPSCSNEQQQALALGAIAFAMLAIEDALRDDTAGRRIPSLKERTEKGDG